MDQNDQIQSIKPKFTPSFTRYAEKIRLEAMPEAEDDARRLFDEAGAKLQPVALFTRTFIDSMKKLDGSWEVSAGGQVFQGKALKALESVHRVFPYVATCGTEMEDADLSSYDMLAPYWLEEIKLQALSCAREAFISHMKESYRITKPMSLNPGSGNTDIWPIQELRKLFCLLDMGNPAGVRLTESSLMIPNKTVAGLLFSSPLIDYDSCEYCEREHCPDRRKPYRETL